GMEAACQRACVTGGILTSWREDHGHENPGEHSHNTPFQRPRPPAGNLATISAYRGEMAEDCQEGNQHEEHQAGGEKGVRDTRLRKGLQPVTAFAKYPGHDR